MEIRFDTATFDDIERDKKIKTEAQLSLIGGTMGLLTGFSIISGVEIVFFIIRVLNYKLIYRQVFTQVDLLSEAHIKLIKVSELFLKVFALNDF